MNSTLFLIFNWIILTIATSRESNRADRARQMLFDNITKFHRSEPIIFEIGSFSSFRFSAEFLQIDDILENFQLVNKEFNDISTDWLKLRLKNFSPYLVFEENWFNAIVYKIINDNFPQDLTLNDPQIHDFTALMVFKYVAFETKKLKVPAHILHGIISFIVEIVFGPNTYVPKFLESELGYTELEFFLGDKTLSYNLPITLQHYFDHLKGPLRRNTEFDQVTIKSFEFLAKKPEIHEHEHFIYSNYFYDRSVQVNLLRKRLLEPIEDNLAGAIIDFARLGPNSVELLKTLSSKDECFLYKALRLFKNDAIGWYFPEAYKHFNMNILQNINQNALIYLFSRDYQNPFNLQDFLDLYDNSDSMFQYFYEVSRAGMPYILKMNILSQFIRFGLVDFNLNDGEFIQKYIQNSYILGFVLDLIHISNK